MRSSKRLGKCTVCSLAAIVLALIAIQFVPYGRDHPNPPVRAEPAWDSHETRELARRACFDCHSNQVRWPWYANVAPVSWVIQYEVEQARKELNFSEWKAGDEAATDGAKEVNKGDMPPWYYSAIHPQARLTVDERSRLVTALHKMGSSR